MEFFGNLLWLIFGGLVLAAGWAFFGVLWCITIIGIPVGMQCFKMAGLCLWPMGHNVRMGDGGAVSLILNIFWIIFGGLELAITHTVAGVLLCITIIGIPFGRQHFKMAKLSLMPFGATIE